MNNWRSLKIREFAITQSGGTPSTTEAITGMEISLGLILVN